MGKLTHHLQTEPSNIEDSEFLNKFLKEPKQYTNFIEAVNDPDFENFSKNRYNSTLRTLYEILKSNQRSQAELKLI